MTINKISICSAAAVMNGDEPISAIPGNSRSSVVCDQTYDNTINQLITSYPWRWAKGQVSLNKLTVTPVFREFKNAFQLPGDVLRVIGTEYKTKYALYQNYLYSNQDSVRIEYIFRPKENLWPVWFVRIAELKMAHLLATAVAEDNVKAREIKQEYLEALREGKAADAQGGPPSRIKADILTRARYEEYDGQD